MFEFPATPRLRSPGGVAEMSPQPAETRVTTRSPPSLQAKEIGPVILINPQVRTWLPLWNGIRNVTEPIAAGHLPSLYSSFCWRLLGGLRYQPHVSITLFLGWSTWKERNTYNSSKIASTWWQQCPGYFRLGPMEWLCMENSNCYTISVVDLEGAQQARPPPLKLDRLCVF